MSVLTEETIRYISEVFNGDKEDLFKYKKGSEIYKFFNQYFNYTDKYQWGGQNPSRWLMTYNKIVDLINNNKINRFLNIILSINYLHTEFKDLTNDQLAHKSKSILENFNNMLKDNMQFILKTSTGYTLMNIDDDLEFIGDGGFANVYKIKSKQIIIKKLKEDLLIDKSIVSRFKREYNITKKLSSLDGVIKVYDYNPNEVSYTMELAEMDLYKYILKNDVPFQYKLLIIYQILDVMQKVHDMYIIHRDLSPNNILLFSGRFKISDFGLGKDLSIFNSHQTHNTNSLGQYYYCDPRQFMKLKEGDKSSDIYSIGKLINFIMTKDPNNSDHELKVISEKSTSASELARYKSIQELNISVTKLVKIISDVNYMKNIEDKIQKQVIDESVVNYILTITGRDLYNKLQNNVFLTTFQKVLATVEDDNKLYNILDSLYEEIKDWKKNKFDEYDNIGKLCISILTDRYPFHIKEHSINLLNYIMNDANRFNIITLAHNLVDEGIEPLLEENIIFPY